jgi:hypothetical protein
MLSIATVLKVAPRHTYKYPPIGLPLNERSIVTYGQFYVYLDVDLQWHRPKTFRHSARHKTCSDRLAQCLDIS